MVVLLSIMIGQLSLGVDPTLQSNLPNYDGPNVTVWSLGRNVDIANDEIANVDDLYRFLDDSSLDGGFILIMARFHEANLMKMSTIFSNGF